MTNACRVRAFFVSGGGNLGVERVKGIEPSS
jgi:hypothetical protein